MPATCPDGWKLFSMPSTPDDMVYKAPPEKGTLTSVIYRRWRTGTYEWVAADGVPQMQGSCGKQHTFTTNFSFEENSTHSIDVGGIFNVPKLGEKTELQVSYGYSFGTASGHAVSIEQTVGPTECYEYLATAIVLKLEICRGWVRDGIPWYETFGQAAISKPGEVWFPTFSSSSCDKPLYLRGGLMICRRWCCPDKPEPKD